MNLCCDRYEIKSSEHLVEIHDTRRVWTAQSIKMPTINRWSCGHVTIRAAIRYFNISVQQSILSACLWLFPTVIVADD